MGGKRPCASVIHPLCENYAYALVFCFNRRKCDNAENTNQEYITLKILPLMCALGSGRRAMEVLEGALRLYKPEEIAMSFNGGKDATVLLHLLRAAVAGTAGAGLSKVNVVQHNSECNNASP